MRRVLSGRGLNRTACTQSLSVTASTSIPLRYARRSNGTLAGSVTDLMGCVRFAVKHVGISLGAAVKCATVNPAKSIGIYDEVGSISEGKVADILLVNERLELARIIHDGKLVSL